MKSESNSFDSDNATKTAKEELQQIFDALPNPTWVIGLNYEVQMINKAMSTFLQMDWREVRGKKCFELCANYYCKTRKCPLKQIRQKKASLELEEKKTLPNGKKITYLITSSPVYNAEGELTGIIEDYTDLTELKRVDDEIYNLAYYDKFTKLPNRVYFSQRLRKEILKAKLEKKKMAVMFLDLDGFKDINDTYGHIIGDELLKKFAGRIKSFLKETELFARWGGDEFTIFLPEVKNTADIVELAERLIRSTDEPFLIRNIELTVGVSIGISIYPEDGPDLDILINKADLAMYYVKRNGKSNFHFYESKRYNEKERDSLPNSLVKEVAVTV